MIKRSSKEAWVFDRQEYLNEKRRGSTFNSMTDRVSTGKGSRGIHKVPVILELEYCLNLLHSESTSTLFWTWSGECFIEVNINNKS